MNLDIEVPPLKILGGASVVDLANEAIGQLSPTLQPDVECDKTSSVESNELERLNSNVYCESDQSVATDSTAPSINDAESDVRDSGTPRQERASITQEFRLKVCKELGSTKLTRAALGVYMDGQLNPVAFTTSVDIALRRHEIFRTRFIDKATDSASVIQEITDSSAVRCNVVAVSDQVAAEQGLDRLADREYDLSIGDTMQITLFQWSSNKSLVAFGYSQLVLDRWTVNRLFSEISNIYNGVSLPPAPQHARDSNRQRDAYDSGSMEPSIEYWVALYAKGIPDVLPVMRLPSARPRGTPLSFDELTFTVRLDAMNALRIGSVSRMHKTASMSFYLTAYHVLLARLSGSADICIGVMADFANNNNNKKTSKGMGPTPPPAMGSSSSLLPMRFAYSAGRTFVEALLSATADLNSAEQHAGVPHCLVLDRLGADTGNRTHAPLFQAVFKYNQERLDEATMGASAVAGLPRDCTRSPYDVSLEVDDDGKREPLLTFKLQSSLYGREGLQAIMNSYLFTLSVFSRNPALRVEEGKLDVL